MTAPLGLVFELPARRATLTYKGFAIHVMVEQQPDGNLEVTLDHPMLEEVSVKRSFGRAVITILGDR